ncbi:DUF6777 domain-containing protein [Streptomyces sp. G5(2025)]|uniref:DUF6777 domain-containing protein n=1 Tax=Streptomyces sp. G5(2025) TaxID=3406628 RepID=UPI003C26F557
MRASTRTYATTFAISAALAAAGCSGDGGKDAADSGRELFMQPVAAQGPDPFTDSTARTAASPPPVTRSPQPPPTGSATPQGTRSVPGGTPGLYGGTRAVGSCDVDRQVRLLTADRARARAFARVSGIEQAAIPDFLRGLTPVVLRADTRVTNHGFRGGSATGYQSVLQAGTAVLVDARGLPRVRCACGNPLKPPVALKGTPRHNGRPWSGYEPTRVIVVTPAPRPVINIVIVNIVDNTWIERKTGDEHGDRDRVTKPPVPPTPTPKPPRTPTPTDSGETPSDEPSEPTEPGQDRDRSQDPDEDRPDEDVVPGDPDTAPTDCPSPPGPSDTPQEAPSALPPGCPSPPSPPTPPDGPSEQEPDTGGLVPDDPELSENPLSDSDPGTFDS